MREHRQRRRHLLEDAAPAEDGHAVGEPHGLVDVVGHEHHRGADVGEDAPHLGLQQAAPLGVDGAERLVEQQHRRVGGQGPGHADPLALAARELVGVAAAVRGQR